MDALLEGKVNLDYEITGEKIDDPQKVPENEPVEQPITPDWMDMGIFWMDSDVMGFSGGGFGAQEKEPEIEEVFFDQVFEAEAS